VVILVEDAAESILSSDVEVLQCVRFGDGCRDPLVWAFPGPQK
jgi:hypothetical protein